MPSELEVQRIGVSTVLRASAMTEEGLDGWVNVRTILEDVSEKKMMVPSWSPKTTTSIVSAFRFSFCGESLSNFLFFLLLLGVSSTSVSVLMEPHVKAETRDDSNVCSATTRADEVLYRRRRCLSIARVIIIKRAPSGENDERMDVCPEVGCEVVNGRLLDLDRRFEDIATRVERVWRINRKLFSLGQVPSFPSCMYKLRQIRLFHNQVIANQLRKMSLRNSPIPRVVPPENMKIDLTQIETSVCELLDGCANSLHQEKGISTTCRIAGGWVRDKASPK